MPVTPSKRVYDFPLPTHISGFQDTVAVSDLQADGLWADIPADLQAKLIAADSWFSGGADITAADLNELPDIVWDYVAAKLNLKWHAAPPPPAAKPGAST